MKLLSINLLPAEYRKSKTDLSWIMDKRVIWPTILLLITSLSFLFIYLHMRDNIATLNEQLFVVNAEIQREKPLLDKIHELDEKLGIIAQKNKALKSIQVSKKRWVILFENISSVLPPNMWLTTLNQNGDNSLELKGTTYDFSEVAEYMV
ncbi:MAG TPA: PilN domain-containing protein, partial [Fibrobacteraceae bacterium]|nr:PilN domain-containing protein [Fibrobacteraceae bacterium]